MVTPPRASASSSMKIKGSLDTSEIDRGFDRVSKGFDGVKGQAKSFGSDIHRMTIEVSNLAKKFILLGLAGATAIVGLASKAPAVAPALAKMGVAMDKISRNLGEALAPAFERVSGWLDKLAAWVGGNKEKIGEVANKFLDWAEAVGKQLLPVLESVGNWAADHPGLFAGIVAGLALAPAVLAGISAISGLVTLMSGATISGSVLAALGYLAVMGAAAGGLAVAGNAAKQKIQNYTGMGTDTNAPTDMSGQTMLNRLPQKVFADLTGTDAPWEDITNANSPAHRSFIEQYKQSAPERLARQEANPSLRPVYSAAEERRSWFLQWWDAVWG